MNNSLKFTFIWHHSCLINSHIVRMIVFCAHLCSAFQSFGVRFGFLLVPALSSADCCSRAFSVLLISLQHLRSLPVLCVTRGITYWPLCLCASRSSSSDLCLDQYPPVCAFERSLGWRRFKFYVGSVPWVLYFHDVILISPPYSATVGYICPRTFSC